MCNFCVKLVIIRYAFQRKIIIIKSGPIATNSPAEASIFRLNDQQDDTFGLSARKALHPLG